MAQFWAGAFAALLAGALSLGCGDKREAAKEPFFAKDVSGASYGRDFRLSDHTGRERRLADFKGKVVLMFFGYTHCPDVCPTTLADMSMVLKRFGTDAQRIQVVFVTLDPERDTPEVLAQYVPSFDPSFLGLSGNATATAATAKEFRVFHQKRESGGAGDYTMDHTAGTFVFDPAGRLRLFINYGQGVEAIAHDVGLLLREDS